MHKNRKQLSCVIYLCADCGQSGNEYDLDNTVCPHPHTTECHCLEQPAFQALKEPSDEKAE
jgi:hypothetical protein